MRSLRIICGAFKDVEVCRVFKCQELNLPFAADRLAHATILRAVSVCMCMCISVCVCVYACANERERSETNSFTLHEAKSNTGTPKKDSDAIN